MKLNQKCIRDLLLYLEEHLYDKPLKIRSIARDFEELYTLDEIVYTFQKLEEGKYIVTTAESLCTKHSLVKSMALKGHNLLDNIRDPIIFQKAHTLLSSVKSFSVEVLSATCAKIIENKINTH